MSNSATERKITLSFSTLDAFLEEIEAEESARNKNND